MQEKSFSGLAVVPGPNMSYLTGSKFHLSERPVVLIIEQNKSTFILPELESAKVSGLDADYVLIFLAGTRYETDSIPLYELDGGGDESKKQWFMAVAGLNPFRYLESDGSTPKPIMFETTLLGDLIPFKISSYIHPETQVQYVSYHDGLIPLYVKDIKLDDPNGPLTLVYASPSFSEAEQSRMITILIYKINHDYTP